MTGSKGKRGRVGKEPCRSRELGQVQLARSVTSGETTGLATVVNVQVNVSSGRIELMRSTSPRQAQS